jgi:hypothetical protein
LAGIGLADWQACCGWHCLADMVWMVWILAGIV